MDIREYLKENTPSEGWVGISLTEKSYDESFPGGSKELLAFCIANGIETKPGRDSEDLMYFRKKKGGQVDLEWVVKSECEIDCENLKENKHDYDPAIMEHHEYKQGDKVLVLFEVTDERRSDLVNAISYCEDCGSKIWAEYCEAPKKFFNLKVRNIGFKEQSPKQSTVDAIIHVDSHLPCLAGAEYLRDTDGIIWTYRKEVLALSVNCLNEKDAFDVFRKIQLNQWTLNFTVFEVSP